MNHCPSCACELELDAAFCGQCGARVRARRKTLVGAELDGRFRVDAKIAEGGFGSIYRATHLASRHVVALKVLHSELAQDGSLAARFRREGETLSSLSSPHTVSVFEVGETDDGTLYIAMELLRGESLLDRFRSRGPLAWRDALSIMKQVCRSLGEAHALGIIHRDLKPANIHLEAHDHVKVLDFGIAKLMRGSDSDDGADLTRVGQAVGTLEYMAPEQLIGAACDGRSDIYALGVLVYEMLTGRRPYDEATGPTSLVAAVMTQPLIPPSTLFDCGCIPPSVDAIVLRCLAKDPKDRFATVGDVIAAIDAVLGPLARGSFSTELSDEDESTWIDRAPMAPVIITPRSQPTVAHIHSGMAYGPTHMQQVVAAPATDPNLPVTTIPAQGPLTPTRAFARGSSSPVQRGELTPPFAVADGSRTHQPPFAVARNTELADGSCVEQPPYPATGSQPLVDLSPPPPPAAVTDKTDAVRPLGALRIALWTVGLLVGGGALGMLITSLIS